MALLEGASCVELASCQFHAYFRAARMPTLYFRAGRMPTLFLFSAKIQPILPNCWWAKTLWCF
ncbi:MAG: hypothetical protein F6K44_05430 [Moorea sp. SIO3E2]|nr:hypothetical protein [Moorena sp. SIO3E2]